MRQGSGLYRQRGMDGVADRRSALLRRRVSSTVGCSIRHMAGMTESRDLRPDDDAKQAIRARYGASTTIDALARTDQVAAELVRPLAHPDAPLPLRLAP
jgi:hypothetical protein